MKLQKYSRGSKFEEILNYSRTIVDGDHVYVAGCSGFNYDTNEIADNITDQAEQAFANVLWCLEQGGASFKDMVRIRISIASHSDYKAAMPIIAKYCKDAKPVNTTSIADTPWPECKIEIDVTAIKNRESVFEK